MIMAVNTQFSDTNTKPITHKVHPNFHGKKGRSGRKKNPAGIMKFLFERIEDNAYELAEAIVQKAIAGDIESLKYCYDRVGGKPVQQTDMNLSGGEELTAGLVTQLFTMLAAKRKELEGPVKVIQIEEPDNATK